MISAGGGTFPWGELPTGAALREAIGDGARPGSDPERLRELQDRVTREAIDAQAASGLDLVTDGQVRRMHPLEPLVAQLDGVRLGEHPVRYPGRSTAVAQPIAEGEIRWKGPALVEDYLFAARGSARPVKVVLVGPFTMAHLAEDRAYGDPSSLAMALAFALNQELRSLQAAGATVVQIDEPGLLDRRADFPIFARIWDVLSRGVATPLVLQLEGGGIEEIYPGVTGLKRLSGLNVDAVSGRESLGLLVGHPLPAPITLGLGVVDGRHAGVETPASIAGLVQALPGLPPADRLVLGPASDLGALTLAAATAKLRALSEAIRLLKSA